MEENIADALKMAGSVLMFVIGLSVSILMFSRARESIQILLNYSDREYQSISEDQRFYYLSNENDKNRYVGLETIVPTIYDNSYDTSIDILFKFPDDYYIYEDEYSNKITGLTAENSTSNLGSHEDKRKYYDRILYGFGGNNDELNKFKEKYRKTPNNIPLWDYLKGKLNSNYKIIEEVGLYYDEDIATADDHSPSPKFETNKNQRIRITYTVTNST